ncbi:MAG: hypothetical protein JW761_09660 [Prolixibacteraceae bacterium]|nr:hypothetical protein [Prolixibacteraceae bacterium]
MKPKFIIPFLLSFMLFNCNQPQKETIKKDSVPDGISVIKKPYKNSPNVIEYEIPVVKGTDIKHGIQKRYYQHGSLYSEIPYLAGKRNGIAYTYYPVTGNAEPVVWKEQPYKDNQLDGICKRYHSDGKLQAEYEYKNGLPATGLKEFYQSGNPVKLPGLILNKTRTANHYYVTARLSDGTKNVDYFIGDLVEGKYLPENLKALQVVNGEGEILVPLTTKKITITAVTFTDYQNRHIVSKSITF